MTELLSNKGVTLSGFYTEEVRGHPRSGRVGFDVVTLDGKRGPLARVKRLAVGTPTGRWEAVILTGRERGGEGTLQLRPARRGVGRASCHRDREWNGRG